jgi:ABC-type multidrug transport system permease subunit
VPAVLLSRLPHFELRWLWYLSVGSVALQMVVSLLLLRRQFRISLNFAPATAPAVTAEASQSLEPA